MAQRLGIDLNLPRVAAVIEIDSISWVLIPRLLNYSNYRIFY